MIHVPNSSTLLPSLTPLPQTTSLAVRDSRWLQLEVCSSSSEDDCKISDCLLAHPPNHVKVENNCVTVCYDYIKRKECKHSSCKYYHPPQHLVDSVLKKGDENKRMRDQHQQAMALTVQPQLWSTNAQSQVQFPQNIFPSRYPSPASILSAYQGTALPPTQSNTSLHQLPSATATALFAAQLANSQSGLATSQLTSHNPQQMMINVTHSLGGYPFQQSNGISAQSVSQAGDQSNNLEGFANATTGTANYHQLLLQYHQQQMLMPGSSPAQNVVLSQRGTVGASLKRPASIDPPTSAPQNWLPLGPASKRPNLSSDASLGKTNPSSSSNSVSSVYSTLTGPLITSTAPSGGALTQSAHNGLLMAQTSPPQTQDSTLYSPAVLQAFQANNPGALAVYLAAQRAAMVQQHQQQQQQHQQQIFLSQLMRSQQSLQAGGMATHGFPFSYPSQPTNGAVPVSIASLNPMIDPNSLLFAPTIGQQSLNPVTNVAYINDKGQLLESLPICRDFKAGKCHRNSDCRYVHLVDENVEVTNGRLTVCRDAAKGRCLRNPCKYYHIPILPGSYFINP